MTRTPLDSRRAPSRGWRRGLALLGLLGAGIVLALILAPLAIDWDSYRPRAVAAIEAASGRRVEIEGPLGVRLLPAPRVTLEGLVVANLSGGTERPFLVAPRLIADLSWGALLGGAFEVRRLELERPRLFLQSVETAGWNWTFVPSGDAEDGLALNLDADAVVVREGMLELEEPVFHQMLVFDRLEGEVAFDRARDKIQVKSEARVFGRPVSLRFTRAAVDAKGYADVSVGVDLLDGRGGFAFEGVLAPPGATPRLSGALEVEAEDAREFLAALGMRSGLPGLDRVLSAPLRATARLEAAGREFAFGDMQLRIGAMSARGDVKLAAGVPVPRLDVALEVGQIDVDELIEAVRGAGEEPGAELAEAALEAETSTLERQGAGNGTSVEIELPPGVAEHREALSWPGLLEELSGRLALGVGLLEWRHGIVRQPHIEASLENGVLTLKEARALFPGGTDIALFGELSADGEAMAFEGNIEVVADSLRTMLEWLGVKLKNVPGDRLQQLNLSAQLTASREAIVLTDLRALLDASEGRGDARLSFGSPLQLKAELAIDRLNADAYFPPARGAEPPSEFVPVIARPVPGFEGLELDGLGRITTLVRGGKSLRGLDLRARIVGGKLWAEDVR